MKTDTATSPLPKTASFQYKSDASQGFGWARSAWKIVFPILGQRYSFHFRIFENKGLYCLFFTHYTLNFTNKNDAQKNGARKTVREAHHQKNDAQKTAAKMGTPKIRDRKMARQKWRNKNDAQKTARQKWRTKSRVYQWVTLQKIWRAKKKRRS